MRLFKSTLFFRKMQHLSKEWRDSVNYFCDLKTRPKNLWKRTWSRCRNMDHDEKGRCETTRQRRNERLQCLNPSSRGSNDDDMMMPQHLLGHSRNFQPMLWVSPFMVCFALSVPCDDLQPHARHLGHSEFLAGLVHGRAKGGGSQC